MSRSWMRHLAMTAASIALLAGCNNGDEAGGSIDWGLDIEPLTTRFIQVAESATPPTNIATLINGEPAVSTGATGLNASGTSIAAVISGGGAQIELSATTAFTKVQVSINGLILYYELTLSAPVTTVTLIIAISTSIPIQNFTAVFRLGDAAGNWGDAFEVKMLALSIPSGEVQVSVSWNAESDVDLWVTDPANEKIYFGHKTSASGGSLDLDANADCNIDSPLINNESIHWDDDTAPTGTYTVEVDYWDSCGGLDVDYIVVIQRKGYDALLFVGDFTGAEGGVVDDLITTFPFPDPANESGLDPAGFDVPGRIPLGAGAAAG